MIRALLLALTALFSGHALATADSDFAARCAAAGVIYCGAFDDAGDLAEGTISTAGDGTTQVSINTGQKTSGAGSLMFKLRAGVTADNIAGAWTRSTQNFGAGTDVYFQWRQRFDSNWISAANNRWNSSYKAINFHGQSSTCQSSEFTMLLGRSDTRPVWYNNCGDAYATSATNPTNWNPITIGGGDGLIQQGSVHVHTETTANSGYNCHFQNQTTGNGNGEGCLTLVADVWYTFYFHIRLNTKGGSSGNNLEAYVARDDGPYKQWAHVTNFPWPSGGDNFINRFRIETYMTELPTDGQGALTDAFTWYDELIISTQPIAAPNSAGGGDVTAPVLTSPSAGTRNSSGTVNATVITDEGNGTLYWAVVTNGGSASAAQIKVGTGGDIVTAGSQAVVGTGTQTVASITGLSVGTLYQIKFLHSDSSVNDSAQASVNLTTLGCAVTSTCLSIRLSEAQNDGIYLAAMNE